MSSVRSRTHYTSFAGCLAGDGSVEMEWTMDGYYKNVYVKHHIKFDGWDPKVKFTNLSNITGLVNISRLAARWNSGQLRLARASDEEYEAALVNPLLAAPSPLHDGFRTKLGRDDVKRRYKDFPGFPVRYERNGPKSAKTVTADAEAAAAADRCQVPQRERLVTADIAARRRSNGGGPW